MNIFRLILPLILLVAVAVYYFRRFWRRRQGGGRVEQLRREYKQKMGIAGRTGDQVIDDMIRRLKQKHPQRSEQWYLEKMLYDLQRDRG